MDKVGHLAAAPGPLACPTAAIGPLACSSRSARLRKCLNLTQPYIYKLILLNIFEIACTNLIGGEGAGGPKIVY